MQKKKINRLKKYQYKKYGKCLNCKQPVPVLNCSFRCANCGYAENWHEIPTYQVDKEKDNEKMS